MLIFFPYEIDTRIFSILVYDLCTCDNESLNIIQNSSSSFFHGPITQLKSYMQVAQLVHVIYLESLFLAYVRKFEKTFWWLAQSLSNIKKQLFVNLILLDSIEATNFTFWSYVHIEEERHK